MKLTKRYTITAAAVLSLLITSCDNKLDLKLNPKEGIAVHTIESAATFDLSARKNWIYTFGNRSYHYSVENTTLRGTSPTSEPFYIEYEQQAAKNSPMVLFYSPTYAPAFADINYIPDIQDQSSLEKFINCDPLRGTYTGKATEHVTGIRLYHYNALLNFKVENAPENAKVRIKQVRNQIITPYRKTGEPDAYMAIVFPYNQFKEVILVVETAIQSYEAVILEELIRPRAAMQYYSDGIGNSSVVNFTARINDQNKLVIEELERVPMSREWPITQ